VEKNTQEILWNQIGAALDTLEATIQSCPEEIWSDRWRKPEYWYTVYHTLFWVDYYFTESHADFVPQPPFGIEELDPAGVLPPRVYTKAELLTYLAHCRAKGRAVVESLTAERAARTFLHGSVNMSFLELLLYVLRHTQHHAAQLILILRQTGNSVPGWVTRRKPDR
jgi:hypothetical protein